MTEIVAIMTHQSYRHPLVAIHVSKEQSEVENRTLWSMVYGTEGGGSNTVQISSAIPSGRFPSGLTPVLDEGPVG